MRLPLAFAVVVLGFAGPVGAADQVPTFDVRQSCRGGSDNPAALESCLKSEAEARTQLVAQWAQFPAAQRRGCIAEAGREMASYVELLTCLQIAGEAKALPKQQTLWMSRIVSSLLGWIRTTRPSAASASISALVALMANIGLIDISWSDRLKPTPARGVATLPKCVLMIAACCAAIPAFSEARKSGSFLNSLRGVGDSNSTIMAAWPVLSRVEEMAAKSVAF
ncbi:MAG: hypothetical protein HZA68_00425 [Rhodovulum sp.]|nr:hypothetical protein [Rhodovulum sp.]